MPQSRAVVSKKRDRRTERKRAGPLRGAASFTASVVSAPSVIARRPSFTASVVYRRAVGDGWAGGTNPLCVSARVCGPSQRLRLGGKRAVRLGDTYSHCVRRLPLPSFTAEP
jgi:hypothetical protein